MAETLYTKTLEIHRKAEAFDKLLDFARSRHELKINFCGFTRHQNEPLFVILCGSEVIAKAGTAEQVLDSLVGQ